MQKDFPKCACGQDVYVHEVMIPVYDDGGSVDCFEPSLHYYEKCQDCYDIAAEEALDREPWIDDEMPF